MMIANLPDIRPSLLLDFANSGCVDPRIQCTRASAATCFGSDGNLRTVPANVPRIDYDPATGKCLGLLVEEAATNLLPQSEDFAQAVWSKVRANIVTKATLGPDGVSLADGIVGSEDPSTEHYVAQANVVPSFMAGDKFCLSAFVKAGAKSKFAMRIRRSLTPASYITGYFDLSTGATNVTGASGGASLVLTHKVLRNGWNWCCMEYVAGASDGADSMSVYAYPVDRMDATVYTGTGTTDIYIFGMQCTKSQYPSSYIRTAATAVTRAADAVQMTLPFSLTSASPIYLTVDSTERNPVLSFFSGLATLSKSGTVADYLGLLNPSAVTSKRVQQYIGGVVKANLTSPGLTLGMPSKSAFAVNAGRIAVSVNGSISETPATNLDRAQEFDILHIGKLGANSTIGIRVISRITLGIADVTNAQLQRLTA